MLIFLTSDTFEVSTILKTHANAYHDNSYSGARQGI